MLRGLKAALKVQEEAKKRGGSRRDFSHKLILQDGVPVIGVLRGFFGSPEDVEHIVGEEDGGEFEDLEELGQEELLELCSLLYCSGYNEESEEEHLRKVVTRRLLGESEPVIAVKHYNASMKGQGGKAFSNCADPEAAVSSILQNTWNFETECRPCLSRQQGSKSISMMVNYYWSIFTTTRTHTVVEKEKGKDVKSYITCKGKRCRICASNRKFDDRDQTEIPKEEMDELKKSGYNPWYLGGSKYVELRESETPQIAELKREVERMCGNCSDGDLTAESCVCPECEEEIEIEYAVEEGWDFEDAPEKAIRCPECDDIVIPVPVFECDGCDDPKPASLNQVPIKILMTKSGQKGNRSYSFSTAGRPLVYEFGESFEMDLLLKSTLPDYESILAPPSLDDQLGYIGAAVDPKTGEPTEGSNRTHAAPTIGRAASMAARGKKADAPSKPKVGLKVSATSKPKKSGFLRRG